MAEYKPFKDEINPGSVETLSCAVAGAFPAFPRPAFVRAVVEGLDPLELKDRVRLLSAQLHQHLPPAYPTALEIVCRAAEEPVLRGMVCWSLCQFVEDHGLEHFEESMAALHVLTERWSAEFAIRPFLQRYPEATLERLLIWTSDPNKHVRRLVSEGTRTRLPWGQRLPHFIADPDPVFALLEHLRDDNELYVRRSVANNLNDLSKDHPARVIKVLERWTRSGNEQRLWIARHALRTLLKQGNADALQALGYGPPAVRLERLVVPDAVRFGDALLIEVELASTAKKAQRLMIDFAIHHVKKNGARTAKVFKWSKRELAPGATLALAKRHPFKPISTRRFYPGTHAVEVLVNGQRTGIREFELLM